MGEAVKRLQAMSRAWQQMYSAQPIRVRLPAHIAAKLEAGETVVLCDDFAGNPSTQEPPRE